MLGRSDGCWFLLWLLVLDGAFGGVIALDHLLESIKLFVLHFSGVYLSDFWRHSGYLREFHGILIFAWIRELMWHLRDPVGHLFSKLERLDRFDITYIFGDNPLIPCFESLK